MNLAYPTVRIESMVLAFTCAAFTCGALVQAQTYTPLYSYGSHTGDPKSPQPNGLMAQGRDGKLYSTTPAGGATAGGAAFNITTSGSLTKILDFASNEAQK